MFFPSVPSRWCLSNAQTKDVFINVSSFITEEGRVKDRAYIIGHTKKGFRKILSLSCYSRHDISCAFEKIIIAQALQKGPAEILESSQKLN